MPNEGTAAMTGAQQRSVAAHQPGQERFQVGPGRRHQLEALRGVPTFGPHGLIAIVRDAR